MNKAITDGLVLMPPAFADGLDVWSREDGTPGGETYDTADCATIVSDDVLGTCLELEQQESVQKLRYTGETPILPGCYLRIRTRVRVVSGPGSAVRIAGWAGAAGGSHADGLVECGQVVRCTPGDIIEVSAIVGTGQRTGVDLAWGDKAIYGHFGLDLLSPVGAIVRVAPIEIEDVTGAFLRTLMDWVDVRDFGAVGDGETDDQAAFAAADRAARGRCVLVSEGRYRLGRDQVFENAVRFVGTVVMDPAHTLNPTRNFNFGTYLDAFGDRQLALQKALQTLLSSYTQTVLDLGGLSIDLTGPVVPKILPDPSWRDTKRIVRNGRFRCRASSGWQDHQTVSVAAYDASDPYVMTSVEGVEGVHVGALVSGDGVGREVYVTEVDRENRTLRLNQPLWKSVPEQRYSFSRFAYALDLSALSQFEFQDIEIDCCGQASGVLLSAVGCGVSFRNCQIKRPRDRGLVSFGADSGQLVVESCCFLSAEDQLGATERRSLALSAAGDNLRIRHSEFVRFGTAMVLQGRGHQIIGNRIEQGDDVSEGPRSAGLVLSQPSANTLISGNSITDASIEWTNEHDPSPDVSANFSFSGLTISANIFACENAAPWFSWLTIKPYGPGHFLQGLNVSGNAFRALGGAVHRVEKVDPSFADLDHALARNVTFSSNSFSNVAENTINPVTLEFNQSGQSASWRLDVSGYMPFGGWAREVISVVSEGPVLNKVALPVFAMPYVGANDGPASNHVRLTWPEPVSGRVHVTVRTDRPI